MKNTILHRIEQVKGKPHHVRKRVVFAIAAAATALIALVWFTGSLATGALSIRAASFAESAEQEPAIVVATGTPAVSGIAGAAGALPAEDAPAHIEIVNTATSAPAKPAEQTTISF